MKHISIKIDGYQFKKSYLVYVIQVTYSSKGSYYYVGQTGDRYHKTARPAFRRFAAHLDDQGWSTQNQVYRGIAVQILNLPEAKIRKVFTKEIKNSVSEFLEECQVEMQVFELEDFIDSDTINQHKVKRQFSEQVETCVILEIIQRYGEYKILNLKKVGTSESVSPRILETIKEILTSLD